MPLFLILVFLPYVILRYCTYLRFCLLTFSVVRCLLSSGIAYNCLFSVVSHFSTWNFIIITFTLRIITYIVKAIPVTGRGGRRVVRSRGSHIFAKKSAHRRR
jgi:hypothetical protein